MLPIKRLITHYQLQQHFVACQSRNDSITSLATPQLGFTQQTQSSRERAKEEGNTYYSIPTEFPTDYGACSSAAGSIQHESLTVVIIN